MEDKQALAWELFFAAIIVAMTLLFHHTGTL